MSCEELEKLIYVKHPNLEKQRSQILSLAQCPPDEFEFRVLFFNYGNIVYRYMNLSRGEATVDDFEDWLAGLPDKVRNRFRADGFEVAKSVLAFQRHVLERRDVGMDEYVKKWLRPADWEKWNEFKESGEDGQ
ncbi:MAG: hypothetical protein EAZ70_06915 [Runella slithyformis]|jgi:hypothetical protein|nr:MAG: hypothetical protein EAY79_06275 [Runella slithyformis]TAF27531.1 MAG: hypothetical protein EAZ70_06915 [Runella slithyformis]TAF46044.1 MAG: hypothetical protein EAZ63_09870 [Runella slithyformis]TAH13433.1 MAG: hypothetical protein EAZ14_05385 [Runella slithyformis]